MGMRKLDQRDVNRIHYLSRSGNNTVTIAELFNVAPTTIQYVLKSRPEKDVGEGEPCARCDEPVGSNRIRRVKIWGRSGEYVFCPGCHGWVFSPENFHDANRQFPGVF